MAGGCYPGFGSFPAAAAANYILNSAQTSTRAQKLFVAASLAADIHAKDFDYDTPQPKDEDHTDVVYQTNARAYFVLSDAYDNMVDRDSAIDALDEAIARAPFMAEQIKRGLPGEDASDWASEHFRSADPWAIQKHFREQKLKARKTPSLSE